ncbi:hypothetical protein FSPOR_1857 [Fusarium sporotrichioides]|uniref:Putative gamma-glutamylcyclotransferase n=1 Tax=Fusarium sporotrichioides TaxID=5514 RepID=A0A395SQ38_FUSSP|nr:hypothetical protein FSPOR_1857 [Fusarium sporotrichioides]
MATVPPSRPVFIYGTLRALPLLAWVLTGDDSNTSAVAKLVRPAKVDGYARFALHGKYYPGAVKHESAGLDGLLLRLETKSQRQKVHNFEGEIYKAEPVRVTLEDGTTVDADIYVWNGDAEAVSDKPWELQNFINEDLQGCLDIYEGIELVGDDA